MAPKVKAKAKAKPKAKAKVAAMRVHPMGRARVAVMRVVAARGRGAARGVLPRRGVRRPAARLPDPGETAEEKWRRGETVQSHLIPLTELGVGTAVVIEEASYYKATCKLAGLITGMEVKDGEVQLYLQPTGTTHDGLLKTHSASPETSFILHKCPQGCPLEEVGDFVVHCPKMRLRKRKLEDEEGWVNNLEKVIPMSREDELAALRRAAAREEEEPDAGDKDKSPGKEKAKEKKAKKEKQKKKKKKKEEEDSEEEEASAILDGSRARKACRKKPQALFRGTGLDAKEKVRKKVLGRARKYLKKKEEKESTSGSSSGSSSSGVEMFGGESVFFESNKVRAVGENYPGALSYQTLSQMRSVLLHQIGVSDKEGILAEVAVPYYRQQVQRRQGGAAAMREMLTISLAVDSLLRGEASRCMDLLLQRFKSCEAVQQGTHWSVAQRLELAPLESQSLTPQPEMQNARKDAYTEAKLRAEMAFPDGRPRAPKGNQKGGQEKGNKGPDRDKKGNKGGKGDQGKKARGEEPNPRT